MNSKLFKWKRFDEGFLFFDEVRNRFIRAFNLFEIVVVEDFVGVGCKIWFSDAGTVVLKFEGAPRDVVGDFNMGVGDRKTISKD